MTLLNTITTGDARELAKLIPDESIDLIFCDPPYIKEHMHLYGWLSEVASHKLKPGGFCLAYSGDARKYEAMQHLGENLTYAYDFAVLNAPDPLTGRLPSTMYWPLRIMTRHKSILAFVKGTGRPCHPLMSVIQGSGIDKRFHIWGQDEQSARYYIGGFSVPG